MSTELTRGSAHLPATVSNALQLLTTSPAQYLEALPIEKMDAERPPNAVTLFHYKRVLDRKRQLMYLSMMIAEVNDFFNVKRGMNAQQIKVTAELILDNAGFYDLTLGNIKACFREKMATAKLYERLDGSIIIQWLREFKSEMADNWAAEMERREKARNSCDASGAITHAVYLSMLEERAKNGNEQATQILADYKRRRKILSPEEARKKELDFFRFKTQYEKTRKK